MLGVLPTRHGIVLTPSLGAAYMYVRVCAYARVCVYACVHVHVYTYDLAYVYVRTNGKHPCTHI